MRLTLILIVNIFVFSSAYADIVGVLSSIDNLKAFSSLDKSCPADIYKGPEQEYKNLISFCATDMKFCLNECLGGSSNHCFGLANNLHSDNIDKKYAERLYAMACQQGLIMACTNWAAGVMLFNPDNEECYARSFELTCGKSDAWGCSMYGLVLARGIGFDKDHELALKVLKIGCKDGINDDACKYAKSVEKEIHDTMSSEKSHNKRVHGKN